MRTLNLKQFLSSLNIRSLLWLFPFVFMFHEFEEWNILPWHRHFQSNIPSDITSLDLRTFFLFIVILFFALTYLSLLTINKKISSYLMLPLITFNFYNGIVHLFWSFYFHTYAPGVIFGFFIGAPLTILIVYKMLNEKLVKQWYILLYAVLSIFLIVQAVSLGNKIEPPLVHVMIFSKTLANWIWF
jgi:hypothetical protein